MSSILVEHFSMGKGVLGNVARILEFGSVTCRELVHRNLVVLFRDGFNLELVLGSLDPVLYWFDDLYTITEEFRVTR
jgi:hypothetical protein